MITQNYIYIVSTTGYRSYFKWPHTTMSLQTISENNVIKRFDRKWIMTKNFFKKIKNKTHFHHEYKIQHSDIKLHRDVEDLCSLIAVWIHFEFSQIIFQCSNILIFGHDIESIKFLRSLTQCQSNKNYECIPKERFMWVICSSQVVSRETS